MKLNCHVWGSRRALVAMTLVVLAGVIALRTGSRIPQLADTTQAEELGFAGLTGTSAAVERAAEKGSAGAIFGRVPLSFEPNRGQTDGRVKFVAHGVGYGLFLTADEAVLKLRARHPQDSRQDAGGTSVRMGLVGARADAEISGMEELPGKSNYFIGNDPSKWQHDVPQFARVRYREVYPGVDLIYYGNQRQLEYDFEIAPGADPRVVQLQFKGSKKLTTDRGDLVVHTRGGDLRLHAPVVYQRIGSEKSSVAGGFVVSRGNRVGFAVGAYDRTKTLVIDPVLNYSSYLGGTGAETGATVAVDAAFNFYVTGATTSPTFPGATGGLTGAQNVFISKFNPGGALLVSTYLGGSGTDSSSGIAVDVTSNVVVGGTTTSSNFPNINGFVNPALSPNSHAFVTQLSNDLKTVKYSTLLGGNGTDAVAGLAVDNKGKAYIIGITTPAASTTPDFPTTPGSIQSAALSTTAAQFFVSKIDPTLSGGPSLVYSTYFGGGNPGSSQSVQGGGIAVDTNAMVYITGGTTFQHTGNGATDFPVLNAAQGTLNCPAAPCAPDVFVAKINPAAGTGAQILYSTYLGGTSADIGNGIAVDTGFNVYVTGQTSSQPFSALTTGFEPCLGQPGVTSCAASAATNAFVAKLNNPAANTAVSLTYFSYLGGSGPDVGHAIAVDTVGVTRVIGDATSSNFPTTAQTPAFTSGPLGGGDAFVARIDTVGTSSFSSRLGGTLLDHGTGVALDGNFNTYVAGDTLSVDFPVAGSPFQPGSGGSSDAFVAKLGSLSDLAITAVTTSVTTVGVGNPVTFTYTIKNNGTDSTTGVTFTDTLPTSGATFTSISSSPGTCAAASGGTDVCSIGNLGSGVTATVTVVLTSTVAGSLANNGSVSAGLASTDPNSANNFGGAIVPVTDFALSVNPSTTTVQAGISATYQVQVSPVPNYPNSVSLACSGLPAGAGCTFSTTPVTITNNSPASSTLTISTTARPVGSATTSLFRDSRVWYAVFLPISGLAFAGIGAKSRRKRVLMALLLGVMLCGIVFLAACGGGSSTPTVNQGTPAGSYPITITGTSGSASHATTTVLVVQ